MRIETTNESIETLTNRVRFQSLDLQPDFQRGDVWSVAKQQRLVDTILRRWHVPPLHVIRAGKNFQEVLDGQQRLSAILAFLDDLIPIDGEIEPYDAEVAALHNYRFSDLPPD